MTRAIPRAGALALRGCIGATAALFAGIAFAAPDLAPAAKIAGVAVAAATAWTPVAGIVLTTALAPAGQLLAPPPARTAELLVCCFLAAWLLSLHRPLGDLSRRSRALLPAALFALCATASWLAYIVSGSAGTERLRLPLQVLRAVPLDHLVFSSPEPETFTLLPLLAGLALIAAAAVVARRDARARTGIVVANAVSAALLAVVTIGSVIQQWAAVEYGGWFLLRYLHGERFALHLADLNAAGSHYVLGMLAAATLATFDRRRRLLWLALGFLIAPALLLAGSRSATLGALIAGGFVIPLARRVALPRLTAARAVAFATLVLVLAAAGTAVVSRPADQGTAANALLLRKQFLVTSARMWRSAPVFGIGIGHFHERSREFMPELLRQVYGYENAHNFFAQQFAELGVAGGVLFIWLAAAGVLAGWEEVRRTRGADAASLGLLAGIGGYLLTCLTGHPLLVPEAAMPFWAAFGALVGAPSADAPDDAGRPRWRMTPRRWAIVLTFLVAFVHLAGATRQMAVASTPPMERGFYALEETPDGTPFVWMTRHGVFYVGRQRGTVTIPVRAPDFLDRARPFRVGVEIAGRHAGVYDLRPGAWTTIEIPLRQIASVPFRRIDLRANQSWSPMRDRGARTDDEPRSIMVGQTRWTPFGGR